MPSRRPAAVERSIRRTELLAVRLRSWEKRAIEEAAIAKEQRLPEDVRAVLLDAARRTLGTIEGRADAR